MPKCFGLVRCKFGQKKDIDALVTNKILFLFNLLPLDASLFRSRLSLILIPFIRNLLIYRVDLSYVQMKIVALPPTKIGKT